VDRFREIWAVGRRWVTEELFKFRM